MNDKKFSVLAAIALTACMILGLSGWTVESARAVDLDQEIPDRFYQPVAEVLAFVYSLKKKELK